jgi:two-component system response regulator FixJ
MAPPQGSAAEASTATVCIVEADAAERAALAQLLGHLPIHVTTFESAEALLSVLDETDCRVLVTEMNLPGKSGLELLGELCERGRHVPTILLSEGSDVGTAVIAMRAGAMDFIEKPVIDRILLRRVKDAINHPAAR